MSTHLFLSFSGRVSTTATQWQGCVIQTSTTHVWPNQKKKRVCPFFCALRQASLKIAWNGTQGTTKGTQTITCNFTWWVKTVRHAKRSHDWQNRPWFFLGGKKRNEEGEKKSMEVKMDCKVKESLFSKTFLWSRFREHYSLQYLWLHNNCPLLTYEILFQKMPCVHNTKAPYGIDRQNIFCFNLIKALRSLKLQLNNSTPEGLSTVNMKQAL